MAHSTLNDNIGPDAPQELMEAAGSGEVAGVGSYKGDQKQEHLVSHTTALCGCTNNIKKKNFFFQNAKLLYSLLTLVPGICLSIHQY